MTESHKFEPIVGSDPHAGPPSETCRHCGCDPRNTIHIDYAAARASGRRNVYDEATDPDRPDIWRRELGEPLVQGGDYDVYRIGEISARLPKGVSHHDDRDRAIAIARAAAADAPPGYYTGDDFVPHAWAVDAVERALRAGRRDVYDEQPNVVNINGNITHEQFVDFKNKWKDMVASLTTTHVSNRDRRQHQVGGWATAAFGVVEATDLKQRAVRLAEEAIELAQAVGVDSAMLTKLVGFVYDRPIGEPKQEVAGISICLLAMANALGISADEVERDELDRVLSKPPEYWAERNAKKNAAGFKATK